MISNHKIILTLKNEYDLDVETINSLQLGADPNSKVFIVKTYQNECYFLKLKQNHDYNVIIEIINFLFLSGLQNIILPTKTKNGALSTYIEKDSVILYPFIIGEDAFKKKLTEEQWVLFVNL